MKNCPTCGHAMDAMDEKPVVKVEAMELGSAGDEGDEEVSAKDEILAELMEQLGSSLDSKLRKKAQPA